MKGIASVEDTLKKLRYRVSRLISMGRVPDKEGRALVNFLIRAQDSARALRIREEGR